MQDGIRYDRPAFNIEEAKSLAAKVADLVIERDCLREEAELLRSILSEIAALRELLDPEPDVIVAAAASNGHLTAARVSAGGASPVDPIEAADEGVLEADVAAEFGVHTSGPEPGPRPETADDERCDELGVTHTQSEKTPAAMVDAGESTAEPNVTATAPEPEAPLPPVVGHTKHQGEPEASERHTVATSERPPSGTLLLKILELFERSDRPLSRWDTQKLLGLPRMPSAELSRLTQQGLLTRVREGTYAARKRHCAGPSQSTGD